MKLDRISMEKTAVMSVVEKGVPNEVAQKAFTRLEQGLGDIKGRKFYGYYAPDQREYHACVAVREGDDAEAKGFTRETLPGGDYLRARLRGDPPQLYSRIGPMFDDMNNANETKDFMRPWIEYYRSHDEVDLLLPIL